ncbi:hypothetical protein C7Y71_011840 [Pseudoprevotella muciniphila]|uniref:Secreted protein n=1 Tax=Pseudoprevotella muciniphila TaxID=2133944 RepID=A0A5P8E9E9_9BACT|nr:hypothetical protein [Pseudoprevotella muciniphila]QFQ13641.1 hypothetical protein C7Y71_011840 [Pseudoprevotella muciniphila]
MKHMNYLAVIFAIMLSMIIIPSCGSDSDEWFDPEVPENTDGDSDSDNTQPPVDYSKGDVMFEDGVYENKYGAQNEAYKGERGRKIPKAVYLQRVARVEAVRSTQNETFT